MFAAILILLTGCKPEPQHPDPALLASISNLTTRVGVLERRTDLLQANSALLQTNLSLFTTNTSEAFDLMHQSLEPVFRSVFQHTANVDPDNKGFSYIMAGSFLLIFSTESATPYLDGFKLKFKIGNTSAAELHGLKVTFTIYSTNKAVDEIAYKAQDKIMSTIDRLIPGSWSTSEVVLPAITTEQLRRVSVFTAVVPSIVLNP